jgi:hypothetical protein
MTRHEVRVSDSDRELLAMKAIAAALDPMENYDRERVLKWAQAKYVDRHISFFSDLERPFMELLTNIQKAAEKGGTSWPALVRIVELVIREQDREAKRLAEDRQLAEVGTVA